MRICLSRVDSQHVLILVINVYQSWHAYYISLFCTLFLVSKACKWTTAYLSGSGQFILVKYELSDSDLLIMLTLRRTANHSPWSSLCPAHWPMIGRPDTNHAQYRQLTVALLRAFQSLTNHAARSRPKASRRTDRLNNVVMDTKLNKAVLRIG